MLLTMEQTYFPDRETLIAALLAASAGASDHPSSSPRSDLHDAVLAGKSVMVVEDEYLVGLEMAQTLRSWGMSVAGPIQTLNDAEAAGAAAEWDCAVLDVNLDGQDTLDFARRL